jgi:hypothetical protein
MDSDEVPPQQRMFRANLTLGSQAPISSWEEITTLSAPAATMASSAWVSQSGIFYLGGGREQARWTTNENGWNYIYKFNPLTRVWVNLRSHAPIDWFDDGVESSTFTPETLTESAIAVDGQYMYQFGGWNLDYPKGPDVTLWRFNTANDKWAKIIGDPNRNGFSYFKDRGFFDADHVPQPRRSGAMVLAGGYVWVMGGLTGCGGTSEMWAYDPANHSWAIVGAGTGVWYCDSNTWPGITFNPVAWASPSGNSIYLFGGSGQNQFNDALGALSSLWRFDFNVTDVMRPDPNAGRPSLASPGIQRVIYKNCDPADPLPGDAQSTCAVDVISQETAGFVGNVDIALANTKYSTPIYHSGYIWNFGATPRNYVMQTSGEDRVQIALNSTVLFNAADIGDPSSISPWANKGSAPYRKAVTLQPGPNKIDLYYFNMGAGPGCQYSMLLSSDLSTSWPLDSSFVSVTPSLLLPPSSAPTANPTSSPVASPVGSPIGSPSGVPVDPPVGATPQTANPTSSPVASPVGSPLGSPSGVPAEPPVGAAPQTANQPDHAPSAAPAQSVPLDAPSSQPLSALAPATQGGIQFSLYAGTEPSGTPVASLTLSTINMTFASTETPHPSIPAGSAWSGQLVGSLFPMAGSTKRATASGKLFRVTYDDGYRMTFGGSTYENWSVFSASQHTLLNLTLQDSGSAFALKFFTSDGQAVLVLEWADSVSGPWTLVPAAAFLSGSPVSASPVPTATTSPATSPSNINVPSNSNIDNSPSAAPNVGGIIAGVVVAVVVIVAILIAILWWRNKKNDSAKQSDSKSATKPKEAVVPPAASKGKKRAATAEEEEDDEESTSQSEEDGEEEDSDSESGSERRSTKDTHYAPAPALDGSEDDEDEKNKKEKSLLVKDFKEEWMIDFDMIDIGEKIGSGAFGVVWNGTYNAEDVAIKQCNIIANQAAIAEFRREAVLLLSLKPHPSIVQVLGISVPKDSSAIYMVMEYCEGGSLDSLMAEKELSDDVKIGMIDSIARGLVHLHRNNVVHRDLAARNILIAAGNKAKISGPFPPLLNEQNALYS